MKPSIQAAPAAVLTTQQLKLLSFFNDMSEGTQSYALDILEDMAVFCQTHQSDSSPPQPQGIAS